MGNVADKSTACIRRLHSDGGKFLKLKFRSQSNVISIGAKEFDSGHHLSPLLPPDYFNNIYVRQFACNGKGLEDSNEARTIYTTMKRWSKNQCQFVEGGLITPGRWWNRPYLYTPRDGEMLEVRLKVFNCKDQKYANSSIKVWRLPTGDLHNKSLRLGRLTGKHATGEVRTNRHGECGAMWAVGLRNSNGEEYISSNVDRIRMVRQAFTEALWSYAKQVDDNGNMLHVLKQISESQTSMAVNGRFGIAKATGLCTVAVSQNLCNSPHYDLDLSKSLAVFVSEPVSNGLLLGKHCFVFPNVEINGVKGLVIDLREGAMIEWDGRFDFHCSSCDVERSGLVHNYGLMVGNMPEDTASPTALQEAITTTCVIDAHKGRDVMDMPNAFIQTYMPEAKEGEDRIYMKITGMMVQILIDMAPEYCKYVVLENGKRVIYVRVLRAIYGMLQSSLLFYNQL
ncbi:unnamed protein product [Cylindrotheca closterium]|uniref:Uncharacterized protein n=1 Tax=Cylindrotheca closterium TaxID=2856 RepID=A0AAD2CL70_9STRA|nr:unnamed protein product [Cylindrotheca closterium]